MAIIVNYESALSEVNFSLSQGNSEAVLIKFVGDSLVARKFFLLGLQFVEMGPLVVSDSLSQLLDLLETRLILKLSEFVKMPEVVKVFVRLPIALL